MKNKLFIEKTEYQEWDLRKLLKSKFPDIDYKLNSIQFADLCDEILEEVDIHRFKERNDKPNIWWRLTIPFLLIFMCVMILFKPLIYIITGDWVMNPKKHFGWFYRWMNCAL